MSSVPEPLLVPCRFLVPTIFSARSSLTKTCKGVLGSKPLYEYFMSTWVPFETSLQLSCESLFTWAAANAIFSGVVKVPLNNIATAVIIPMIEKFTLEYNG